MESKDIFIKQNSDELENLSGKLTRTSVLNTIPSTSLEIPINKWEDKYKTEWRWRFLKLDGSSAVEISYKNRGNERLYYNKYGKWVERKIPKGFDRFVDKEFYYYN